LASNKFVEVGIGEHAARTLHAVANDDVFERTRRDVTVEGLDRAAQLRRRFGQRAQPVRRARRALAATAAPWSKGGRGRR